MDALKIKYHNKNMTIYCLTNDFSLFLNELNNKLTNSFFQKEDGFKAYFSFPYALTSSNLYYLFELCEINHAYIMGVNHKKEEGLTLLQECFYSGESYILNENVVYIGDIEKDVYIKTAYNLYVVGEIKGKIDALFPSVEISASALDSACIRIFDTKFHHLTKSAPCKVYYDKEELKIH